MLNKLTIIFALTVSMNSFGQKMPEIDTVEATINGPNFIEHSSFDSAYFRVGQKILVNLLCDKDNIKSKSSGIIRHSYYELENIFFESVFYIYDTTIVRSILNYEGKNTSDVLSLFNLKKDCFEKVGLFTRFYSKKLDNKVIRCWLKRNHIVYEEQIIE